MNRIEGKPVGQAGSRTTAGAADRNSEPRKDFSEILARKKPADKTPAENAPEAPLPQTPAIPQIRVEAPKAAAPASEPRLVQSLVQEILVAAGPHGKQEVRIQFDSKTLQGLHVTIRRDEGGVSMEFVARTPAVASILDRHAPQLTHALAQRGVPVAEVRIRTEPATSAREPQTRGESGGRGGGRERRR